MRAVFLKRRIARSILFSLSLFVLTAGAVSGAEKLPAPELIAKAWDMQGKRQYDKVFEFTQACIETYKQEADQQHATLTSYPSTVTDPFTSVALAYFIQAEALMRQQNWK